MKNFMTENKYLQEEKSYYGYSRKKTGRGGRGGGVTGWNLFESKYNPVDSPLPN